MSDDKRIDINEKLTTKIYAAICPTEFFKKSIMCMPTNPPALLKSAGIKINAKIMPITVVPLSSNFSGFQR